jgi:ferredoxin-NADP reductase
MPEHGTAERELVVAERCPAAEDVVALTMAPVDGEPLPAWEPGAHVDLLLGNGMERQFSLCGDPDDASAWRIAVLREQAGRGGSAYVHDALAPGTRVRVRGPRNHFALEPAPSYLFVAGGIGITPILPMLAAADRAGAAWRLLYGGRRRATMAFLDRLAAYGDRVDVSPQDETGLLDLDAALGAPAPGTLVYCCGPEPLLRAVEERCAAWPEGALHTERFAPAVAPGDAAASPGEAFEVELADGRTLGVAPGTSILETLEAAGVGVLSSCREGTCGTCETGVLQGEPDHRDAVLTPAERAENDVMMICVSRSHSPKLVLDL